MLNYKQQAADNAFKLIRYGQTIGLGDGETVLFLADLIASDLALAASLRLTSSSGNTLARLKELGLEVLALKELKRVDIYFDGCDAFDPALNALKSGAGIHTVEKILAGMASEFILIGDSGKYSKQLPTAYPLVIEVIPAAYLSVVNRIEALYDDFGCSLLLRSKENRPLLSVHGNYLLNVHFEKFPELPELNISVKMIPGVVDHSLFYQMATSAIISGPEGIQTILRPV